MQYLAYVNLTHRNEVEYRKQRHKISSFFCGFLLFSLNISVSTLDDVNDDVIVAPASVPAAPVALVLVVVVMVVVVFPLAVLVVVCVGAAGAGAAGLLELIQTELVRRSRHLTRVASCVFTLHVWWETNEEVQSDAGMLALSNPSKAQSILEANTQI